jgi:uncharacterized protein
VTSFTEFERAYGGLGLDGTLGGETLFLAHAARAFFENGGRRLYVSRVFTFSADPIDVDRDFAKAAAGNVGTWRARWPASAGSTIKVSVRFRRSKNILVTGTGGVELKGVGPGAAVEQVADRNAVPPDTGANKVLPTAANIKIVGLMPDGRLGYVQGGTVVAPTAIGDAGICHITLDVDVEMGDRRDSYTGLELGAAHPRSIDKVLDPETPADDLSLVWFEGIVKLLTLFGGCEDWSLWRWHGQVIWEWLWRSRCEWMGWRTVMADCVFQTAAAVMIWFQTAKRLVISVRHSGALIR